GGRACARGFDPATGELVVADVVVVEITVCIVGDGEAPRSGEPDDVSGGRERAALVGSCLLPRDRETVLCRPREVVLHDVLPCDRMSAACALDGTVVVVMDAAALDAGDRAEIDFHALVGCAGDATIHDDVVAGATIKVSLSGPVVSTERVSARRP